MILFFVHFVSTATPILGIYELAFGEWQIESSKCFNGFNNFEKTYYTINISETSEEAILGGKLFLNLTSNKLEFLDSVSLTFDPHQNDTCSLSIGEQNIGDFQFERSRNGLLSCTGQVLSENITYSITLLSYKAIEAIFYDNESHNITIFRMFRSYKGMENTSHQSIFSYFPFFLVILFMLTRLNKKQDENKKQVNEKPSKNLRRNKKAKAK